MKYTPSRDGIPRATLHIPVRLTAEEIYEGTVRAAEMGYTSLRAFLQMRLRLVRDELLGKSTEGDDTPID